MLLAFDLLILACIFPECIGSPASSLRSEIKRESGDSVYLSIDRKTGESGAFPDAVIPSFDSFRVFGSLANNHCLLFGGREGADDRDKPEDLPLHLHS